MKSPPNVFCVRNNKTGGWIKAARGKFTWAGVGQAKNGFLASIPYPERWKRKQAKTFSFADFPDMEVVECVVIPKEEYDRLIKAAG